MNRTAALLVALALILAACGGADEATSQVASISNGSSSTTLVDDAAAGEIDQEQAALQLTECLREQGLDIDDPTVGADGNVQLGRPNNIAEGDGARGEFRTAFEACQDLAEGLGLGFGRADETQIQDTLFEFAACMRDNGYDMADPDFSNRTPGDESEEGDGGPGQGGGPFGDVDQDDPDFQAAQEVCGDILGGFGPGGGPGLGRGPAAGGGEEG